MKIHAIILVVALVTPIEEYAQTRLNRTIPLQAGQKIEMSFDYPEVIRVSTWEKNEILIQGTVSINGGENDDAFQLETQSDGKTLRLTSTIRDLKRLPERVTVIRDGQKMIFRDKAELRKYQEQHGQGYKMMSMGPDIEIHLEIKVPRNTETGITSVYGMVEILNFSGPLTVEATYGGVDASLSEKAVGELKAETNYGQIYTNLDVKFNGDNVSTKDFYTFVTARPGSGPSYSFESRYGNVYLRKAQ